MSKPLRGIVERYEDTMTDRTCKVWVDHPGLEGYCGARIVEVRMPGAERAVPPTGGGAHVDNAYGLVCEKGHVQHG